MVYRADFLANLKPAVCSICLNRYDTDDHNAIELPNCSHVLGKSCLQELVSAGLASSNKCPTCRSELFEVDPIPKYEEMLENILTAFIDRLVGVLVDELIHEEDLTNPSQALVYHMESVLAEHITEEWTSIEEVKVPEFTERHGLAEDFIAIESFLEDAKQALFDSAWVSLREALGKPELQPSQWLIQDIEQIGSGEPVQYDSENGGLDYGEASDNQEDEGSEDEWVEMEIDG